MNYILVPALLILMGLVLYSLIKGIIAFLQTTKIDLESGESHTVPEMQAKQNKAMFQRVMYQGLAILVVVIIMAAAQ